MSLEEFKLRSKVAPIPFVSNNNGKHCAKARHLEAPLLQVLPIIDHQLNDLLEDVWIIAVDVLHAVSLHSLNPKTLQWLNHSLNGSH